VGSFCTNTFGELDSSGKGGILFENGVVRRILNSVDEEFTQVEIVSLDSISKCVKMQNEGKRVRALLIDQSLPTLIKTAINTIRNIKDLRSASVENGEHNDIQAVEESTINSVVLTFEKNGLCDSILEFSKNENLGVDENFLKKIWDKRS